MALAFDVNILVVEAVDRTALEDPRDRVRLRGTHHSALFKNGLVDGLAVDSGGSAQRPGILSWTAYV